MIATFGRGRHGAEMTPTDGAFMLFGLLSAGEAIHVHKSVDEILQTKVRRASLVSDGKARDLSVSDAGRHLQGLYQSGPLEVVAHLLAHLARDRRYSGRPMVGGGALGALLNPIAFGLSAKRSTFGLELDVMISSEEHSTLVLTYQLDFGRIDVERSMELARDVEVLVRLKPQCAAAIAECLGPGAADDE